MQVGSLEKYEIKSGAQPPLLFQLARWMIRRNISGGWRLWSMLLHSGSLNFIADYKLTGSVRETPMRIPLYRAESSWSAPEIEEYDNASVRLALALVARFRQPSILIDCGADIGMIASAFVRECESLTGVLAFEPNPESYRFLAESSAAWPVNVEAVNAAVGLTQMQGRLEAPFENADSHACYIVEDPNGPISVVRIDDRSIDRDRIIILKVDVEGAELDVIRGAGGVLAAAPGFVVIFEAHPKVFARNGVDPIDVLKFLADIAPIESYIAERPDQKIDLDTPFFDQVSTDQSENYNIICTSGPALP